MFAGRDLKISGALIRHFNSFFCLVVGKFFKTDDTLDEVQVTVGKDLTLTCPPRTLSRNVFYHWGGRRGVTGAWFLPQAKHYMIMEDGTLLFANVKDKDLEYFNVVKNGVSCSIESKGKNKRLAFSQRFLLLEVGGTNIRIILLTLTTVQRFLLSFYFMIISCFVFSEKNENPFGPTIRTKLKDREVPKGEKFVVMRCGAVGL